jgi:hypothetical protein
VKYYVQKHESGVVGNCLVWWRKGGHGYTCNLDDAEVFEGNDSRLWDIVKCTEKYTVWEKDYIDLCAHRHVDHQYVDNKRCGMAPFAETTSERDWTEDFAKGSNRYVCSCTICCLLFWGDKQRTVCRKCAKENAEHHFLGSY